MLAVALPCKPMPQCRYTTSSEPGPIVTGLALGAEGHIMLWGIGPDGKHKPIRLDAQGRVVLAPTATHHRKHKP